MGSISSFNSDDDDDSDSNRDGDEFTMMQAYVDRPDPLPHL